MNASQLALPTRRRTIFEGNWSTSVSYAIEDKATHLEQEVWNEEHD